jgi:hypothetical protein
MKLSRRAPARALALFLGVVGIGGSGGVDAARAQSVAQSLGDPARCVVVVDDAGNVGLRIADAQSVHEAVVTALRKRLGTDAVVYEGSRKNAEQMKKMLGSSAETTIQDEQLKYYDAAMKAASWRVRVRFGQTKGQHWITLSCRKAGDDHTDGKSVVEEKRFTGKTFIAAKEAMDAALPEFCSALPTTATLIPVEGQAPRPGEIPGLRKKELKPWTPPPKR